MRETMHAAFAESAHTWPASEARWPPPAQLVKQLPRRLRVLPARSVQVREAPFEHAEPLHWVVQLPGSVVLTTGRLHGEWVELRNAHLRTGWAPIAAFAPCATGGWHGDQSEQTGGGDHVINCHNASMLQITLAPIPTNQHFPQQRMSGGLRISLAGQQAHIWIPQNTSWKPLPLLLVLHGSRPMDWNFSAFTERWQRDAELLQIIVIVPESLGPTWDFLLTGQRGDVDFMQATIHEVHKFCPVDERRVAAMGMSDGASLALSMALHNPHVFQAALIQAAGFFINPPGYSNTSPQPAVFMEYGADDHLFGIQTVAIPNRDRLVTAGYAVQFQVIKGAGHAVREGFFVDALAFWLALSR
eukprot:TRINITY_DN104236_c0_g1_i1.p1 TRINITY_DN104236_c0_g1~~TRINITY_DN104236_c0_g1_i1.p1  ORF type:complete len:358 (+),score=55.82 TRINITY_DN104236_c0_g1_i1:43-1116(+)